MPYDRRSFAGASAVTTLNGDINATATSIIITDATGWPTGSTGPFYAVIAPEEAGEEKILVTSRSGTTLILSDSSDRGADGTTAQSHTSGDGIYHSFSSVDADEANYAVFNTVGRVTTKGDLLAGTSANTLGRVPSGADSQFLVADGAQTTGVRWGPLPDGVIDSSAKFMPGVVDANALASNAVLTVKLVDGAVTLNKMATNSVGSAQIVADAVTTAKIASANVTSAKIADNSITLAKMDDASVDTAELVASAVTTAKIEDDAVTAAKIPAGVIPTIISAVYTTDTTVDSTNASYAAWGGTTNIAVPTWAGQCFVTCVISTVLPVTASATVNFRVIVGTDTSNAVRQDVNGMENVGRQIVIVSPITLTATGTKAIGVQAQRTAGGGAFRATDAATQFHYQIVFTT